MARLRCRRRCAASCAAQLEFGARRRRHQTLLRVSSTGRRGRVRRRGLSYSVVELIIDDMPFLVDTLSMTLAQLGLSVQLIIHPILRVRRDAARRHRIAACRDRGPVTAPKAACANPGSTWRIDRVGDAGRMRSSCGGGCWRRSADVRRACDDWMRMRNSGAQAVRRHQPPPAAAARRRDRREPRAAAVHGGAPLHLPRLSRKPRCAARPPGPALRAGCPAARSGCCAAACRHAQRQRHRRSANIRRALRSPELLIITKANLRSTVHRPGYLDYIGVKRYDARGRVIGEARILGLWTSHAYQRRSAPGAVAASQAQARASSTFRSRPTATTASACRRSCRRCRAMNCSRPACRI